MKFLQKLGKSLMLPVACLPICGILMGLGYWMCPATMQGGEINGIIQQIGFYLVKAGGALIDNMAILFAIGIGVGMADDNDGTAALSALASWLMITNLLSTANVSVIRTLSETSTLAFDKIANPFIGIIAGLIGSMCYNRFKNTQLPDWLSFFSGKRCVAIVSGVVSIIASVVLLFVWPGYLRSTGCTWRSNRKPGCCWSWYLCILQQTAHPIRSAPCTEQRILVRYDRPWRSDTLLGRRDISRCYMEPWYVHVRILPMYDVRYSWCCACYGTYSKTC